MVVAWQNVKGRLRRITPVGKARARSISSAVVMQPTHLEKTEQPRAKGRPIEAGRQ